MLTCLQSKLGPFKKHTNTLCGVDSILVMPRHVPLCLAVDRKRRRQTASGALGPWEVLLGGAQQAGSTSSAGTGTSSGLLLQESSTNVSKLKCFPGTPYQLQTRM